MDKIKDFFSTVVEYFNVGVLIVGVLLFILVLYMTLRYMIRYLYGLYRKKYMGEIVWHEVSYEGGASAQESSSVGLMNNIALLISQNIGGKSLPVYTDRPESLFAIRKSEEDQSTHFYVGINEKRFNESATAAWASTAGYSIERVDPDEIGIITSAPVTFTYSDFKVSNITDSPVNSTIGAVMSRIQNMDSQVSGTVVMALEPMRPSEVRMMSNNINGETVKQSGEIAALRQGSTTRSNISHMTDLSPSRGVLVAFSDHGDTRESRSLLEIATSSISALGIRGNIQTYTSIHTKTGLGAIIPTIFLGLCWLISQSTPLMVMTVVSAVLTVLSIVKMPFMSTMWVSLYSRDGYIVIPPFWRYSLRRKFQEWKTRISPFDIDTGQLESPYVARPSCREILYFYQSSVLQFASLPISGKSMTNISTSAVPQVSMSGSVNKDIEDVIATGDVSYLGMSAKTFEPVYRVPKDINFGVSVGGDAGSGKTNYIINDFIGVSRLARKTDGVAGDMTINPIWLETKPDNIEELVARTSVFDPLVLNIHSDREMDRLCLEGPRISDGTSVSEVQKNIGLLVDMIKAVWGDGMMERSKNVIRSALMASMLLNRSEIDGLGITNLLAYPDRPNVIELSRILVGAESSINIVESLETFQADTNDLLMSPDRARERDSLGDDLSRVGALKVAIDSLVQLHGVRDAMIPSQGIFANLVESRGLFETVDSDGDERIEYDISRVHSYGGPVILDMTSSGSSIGPENVRRMTMMVHFALWASIRSNCKGWASLGRYIPIYADEVTNLVGRRDMPRNDCQGIIDEVRDQGRSFGASHVVGYQNFKQMPETTENTIRSFASAIYFRFPNPDDVEKVLAQLGETSPFTEAHIKGFPQGFGIASLRIDGIVRRPFTIKTPFSGDWIDALERNNYDVGYAFDDIYDDERAAIKNEGRRKVSRVEEPPLIEDDVPEDHYILHDDDDVAENHSDTDDLSW